MGLPRWRLRRRAMTGKTMPVRTLKAKSTPGRMASQALRCKETRWPRCRCLGAPMLALLWTLLPIAATNAWAADDPNQSCLMCHEDPTLKNAAGHSLFVNQKRLEQSIHGKSGLSCVSCHADLESVKDFPHAEKLSSLAMRTSPTPHVSTCHASFQKNRFGSRVMSELASGPREVHLRRSVEVACRNGAGP